jgi:hypothetical protein
MAIMAINTEIEQIYGKQKRNYSLYKAHSFDTRIH